MKVSIAAAAAFASAGLAAPAIGKRAVNDFEILNYALTLEHLESVFYNQYLGQYSQDDFHKAMHSSPQFYKNLNEVKSDESTHVTYLTNAITKAGGKPVAECKYDFGVKTVMDFLALSSVLEGVGVSAYLGAAQFISSKPYLTAAGSILTVEARHVSNIRTHLKPNQSPYPSAFDVPLSFNQVYSLASQFITSCPQGNTQLPPLTAYPALTGPKSVSKPGDTITVTSAKALSGTVYYTWAGAMDSAVAKPVGSGGKQFSVTVPSSGVNGQSYVTLTKASGAYSDANAIAGPAIVEVTSEFAKLP